MPSEVYGQASLSSLKHNNLGTIWHMLGWFMFKWGGRVVKTKRKHVHVQEKITHAVYRKEGVTAVGRLSDLGVYRTKKYGLFLSC